MTAPSAAPPVTDEEVDRMALDIVRWGYRETAKHIIAFQRAVSDLQRQLAEARANARTQGTYEVCKGCHVQWIATDRCFNSGHVDGGCPIERAAQEAGK